MPLIRGCSTTISHMVMKVLNNLMELKKRCSTAQFLMVVKDKRYNAPLQNLMTLTNVCMAAKVNMQLTTRFISAGEHNIINIDLKAIVAFFLEWR